MGFKTDRCVNPNSLGLIHFSFHQFLINLIALKWLLDVVRLVQLRNIWNIFGICLQIQHYSRYVEADAYVPPCLYDLSVLWLLTHQKTWNKIPVYSDEYNCFQPVCHNTLACCEWSPGSWVQFRAIGDVGTPAVALCAFSIAIKTDAVPWRF